MRSKFVKIFLLLLIISGVCYGVYAKEISDAKKLEIQPLFKASQTESILLKSRKFTPAKGINSIFANEIKARAPKKTHVLLQFENIPTAEQKKQLSKKGVELLSYIPNKAWLASIPSEKPEEIAGFFNVRAITEILPEDKISQAVKNKNYLKNEDGTVNLSIMFFNDIDLEEASSVLKKYGQVADKSYSINAIKLVTEENFISELANQETVQWIDVTDKILQMHNDGNRENIGVNILQAPPYSLSGTGVVTAEWDGGWVDATHDDLQGRVTIGDTGSSVGDHATHVAGTMLGNGALSASAGGTALQWRGMATSAAVISYEWWDDSTELNNEYNTAINTHNVSLSQNSWGYEYTACGNDCSGGYDSYAAELDGIARGSKGKKISLIWSAGNKRGYNTCDSGSYDCIGIPATAKNAITVGATNSNDDSMTYFSSWGPTNDGRLKPEVTAPGCQIGGDGGIKSTLPTDTYGVYCGTSMSAPTVSGVVALMLEEFAAEAIYPLPSTNKALLIHTAKDLGNAGPDYSFGYGRVRATTTIDKIKAGSYLEDDISHGGTDAYTLNVPAGTTEVKITLVWDDKPAAANANPALVNDLDLIVKDPNNTQHYPWTLNPASPSSPAVRTQADHLNNVEQVLVNTSITPGNWTIEVSGYNVPYAPQTYSLIFTPNYGANSVIGNIYKDTGYSQEEKFFDRTDPVYIEAYVTSAGSPLTGATVTAALKLSDGTPVTTITLQDAGGGYYRNSWDSTSQTPDVYLVDINVADPALNTKAYFHLYPQSGVSSYRFDYDNDANNDYVLENKHLIAVFDSATNTDKSLLYLEQKDTDLAYTFAGISDTNTIGRGEITTADLDNLKFHTFSLLQLGENLSSTSLEAKIELAQPEASGQSAMFDDDATGGKNPVGAGMKAGFTTATSGTLEFWTRCRAQTTGDSFDIMLENSANTVGPDIYLLSGNIGYYDGAQKTIMAYTPDQWYHFKIAFNAGSDTMDIYIDDMGTPKATGAGFWSPVADISQIEFDTGQWLSGVPSRDRFDPLCYVDDINIYSGATPLLAENFEDDTAGSNPASPWTVIEDSINTNVEISNTVYHQGAITSALDFSVQMKTEDADYLVYKLSNFDEYIDDISDIFSPISGTLGASVADDRYHFGNGTDGAVSSLTPNTWTNFTTSSNEQRYVAVYDNSTSSDPAAENIISLVYFPNASTTAFQNTGAWYETSKGGLRLKYDTTAATSTNEAEYILAFTKGNYTNIDYWMPTIASGQFPSPNFMSGKLILTRPNFPANAWQMISVPLEPTTSTPEAVIGDDVGNVFYDWMLARWQPGEEKFKYHQAACCPWAQSTTSILSIAPGSAYWLTTRLGPYDIDATGSLVPDSDYYILLSPGVTSTWNQIGVPFNYSVAWTNSTIQVKYGETTVDLDTAQTNNWVENKIWWWNGSEYQFAVAPEGQLNPWEGYWVRNFVECDLIISPAPIGAAAAASTPSSQAASRQNLPKTRSNGKGSPKTNELPSWKIQLSATAGAKKDTYNFAGIAPASSDDYDALDVSEPPAISSGVNLYFPHPEWLFSPGNYAQDIRKSEPFRNPKQPNSKEWYFEIKNDLTNTPVTLKWAGLEQVESYQLSLVDLDTNQTIDIYNTNQYTYQASEKEVRHFKLTALPQKTQKK